MKSFVISLIHLTLFFWVLVFVNYSYFSKQKIKKYRPVTLELNQDFSVPSDRVTAIMVATPTFLKKTNESGNSQWEGSYM